jgi:hypothetical protein
MSVSRQSYSRSDNIALFIQSVKQLNSLCKQFSPKELGHKFIVRVKMMEMLAQQAFKYSIAVSYLKDSEYSLVAEKLDDVYLHQSRQYIRNVASSYGSLATRDYDSMRDALDLIDERLKTVKVVCYKKRPYKFSAKKHSALYTKKSGLNPFANEFVPKNSLNPLAKEWTPSEQQKMEKTPEEKETNKKCEDFNRKINVLILTLHELRMNANIGPETKLITQCEYLCELFTYITENIEVLKEPRYHKRTSAQLSDGFVKILLKKITQFIKDINQIYDKLRCEKLRSNPALRAIKIKALESIKRAQKSLKFIVPSTR